MVGDLINLLTNTLGIPLYLFIIVVIWSLVWKALALWKSARLNQPIWFIVLLVVNTIGIIEILYLFLFSKINLNEKNEKNPSRKKKKK